MKILVVVVESTVRIIDLITGTPSPQAGGALARDVIVLNEGWRRAKWR